MSQIVAMSKYGFKLDSLKNQWEGVDKCLLKREIFLNLKKGDLIEVLERNKSNFIIEFKVLNDKGGEANHLQNTCSSSVGISSLPSSHSLGTSILEREGIKHLNPLVESSKTPSVQDRIMYAQCVNIAFSKTTYYSYLDDEQFILGSFDLADKIHAEFVKRCSR